MLRNATTRKAIALSAVGVALAAAVTAGTVSIAAAVPTVAAGSDLIRVCVKQAGGDVRYESAPTKKCRSGEALVTWNAEGERGVRGATGLRGMRGPAGLTGPVGQTGQKGDTGAAGVTGPAGQSGATGSQGPAGVAGTAGATGPAGPQGSPGFAGYEAVTITSNGGGSLSVPCQPGDIPTGGGFGLTGTKDTVTYNGPFFENDDGLNGWSINFGGGEGDVTVFVLCAHP